LFTEILFCSRTVETLGDAWVKDVKMEKKRLIKKKF